MRFRKKYIYFFMIFSILLSIYQICSRNTFLNVKLNEYAYVITDFFEYYIRNLDESVPASILKFKNDKNHLCTMPILDYKDKIAMNFLDSDKQSLKVLLESCPHDKSYKKILLISTNDQEIYEIQLDIQLLQTKFKLPQESIKCFAQRFDKKLNETEENEETQMLGPVLEFNKENGFKIFVDQFGYFYVCCQNSQTRFSKIFDQVLVVLPWNMSKLFLNRHKFNSHIEEFKTNLEIPKQMLYDSIKLENLTQSVQEKLNVLAIGIDSLSANHFKRVFPLTYKYLNQDLENNIIFEHFNSVGSNTYPNMIAMLTGIVEEGINDDIDGEIKLYRKFDSTFHDHLPYIWNEYEKLGYLTMFQEDKPSIAIFNYYKKGFRYWPTCLYGRGFWLKYYETRSGPDKCHFNEPTYITWLSQIENFVKSMNLKQNKHIPYFSFNFLTEYTHNFLAIPPELDSELSDMLKRLESEGHLDKTLLIFFSDHGNRLKFFAYATELGKLERYLPFLSVKLPKKMVNTRYFENVKMNRDKLVSFFDIYQTLREFYFINKYENINGHENEFKVNSKSIRNQRGISLFEEIPQNRSCLDAFIPNSLCSCLREDLIEESEFEKETKLSFLQAGKLILGYINDFTKSVRDLCKEFELDKIVSFKILYINKIKFYKSVLVLNPGDAWFETTLKMKNSKILQIYSKPNRISAYGNQSFCVQNPMLVNYCFCKDFI